MIKPKVFYKNLTVFLLFILVFQGAILAQELDSVVGTGLFTDSSGSWEKEVLVPSAAENLNARVVWTFDKTDFISGIISALAAYKNISLPGNGLEDPEISGYMKSAIFHSASTITAVNLAKQGKIWGDVLYLDSPALNSQEDFRQIRNLTSQGKGFNKIVLYTGDDIVPNFKKIQINFSDYSIQVEIVENLVVSGIKLLYEDRNRAVDVVELLLKLFVAKTQEKFGKEPLSVIIYGDVPGNKIEIKWADGSTDSFFLQKDAQTGMDFQNGDNIFIIPLFTGQPHGSLQLVQPFDFKYKYGRMPGVDDVSLFRQMITEGRQSKAESAANVPHDPNELSVSPAGDIKPGDTLTYTIQYENEGEGIAYGVYFTDTLEEDMDETTLSIGPVIDVATGQQIAGPGKYNTDTRTITWFVGEVGSKQGGKAIFSVKVKGDAPDGAEVINYATVYFPSVPEATRTNGTVNKVATFVDNIAPITTASLLPSANQAGWNNADVTISLSAVDDEGGSGVAKTEYSLDNTTWTAYTTPFIVTNEGTTTVYYKSTDNLNNTESTKSLEVKLDKTPPNITFEASPQANPSGWNNTDVTITFNATDTLSGVAQTTSPQTVSTEGSAQHIGGEAIDLAGNQASTFATLNIDKTKPVISITSPQENQEYFYNQQIPLTYAVTDNLSQIASTSITLDSQVLTNLNYIQPQVGPHTLTITSTDKASNQETSLISFTVKLKADLTIKPEVFILNNSLFFGLVKFPAGFNTLTITDASCDGAPAKKIIPLPHNSAILFFKRQEITQLPLDTAFTLRGHFNNGLIFEGTDTIKRVISSPPSHRDQDDKEHDLDRALDDYCNPQRTHQDYSWIKREIQEWDR